ncbi:MAG: KTSC domain-containing protein [Bacteroidota bacterium]
MKRIADSRKLFGVTKDATLAELKVIYRNLVKEWHPDKYRETDTLREEAEQKSQDIIHAYHFLVSISPETHALNAERYAETTTECMMEDFNWKGHTLKITFLDGSTYEYLGVPHSLYTKLINSNTQARFVRRHIVGGNFTYRNISKNAAVKL